MLKHENIICISSIDWDFIWQGHQEIMSTLASNNVVLFIENTGARALRLNDFPRIKKRFQNWFKSVNGFRKEKDNLYIFSPLVLPFPYSRIARWINRYLILGALEKWMNVMDFDEPIIWVFLPTGLSLDIINNLRKKAIVYYCIDSFADSSIAAKKIIKTERKMIATADVVFATSKSLFDYCQQYNSNVYLFPFAVNIDNFFKIRDANVSIPKDILRIKHPIVGYVGGIHKWIDQELLKELSRRNQDINFVFVGPIQTDISQLLNYKNVFFLGKKEHRELPLYIKEFDIGIIPYLLTKYTMNVYPTKLNEYLVMGKAVISTSLPEVQRFNQEYERIISIAKDIDEFNSLLRFHLNHKDTSDEIKRRVSVAEDNNWINRIEKMNEVILEKIKERSENKKLRWKEDLLLFYLKARRRFFSSIIFITLIYLVIFRTSFVWFIANPLKIKDRPVNSDAIVVFGGGVGETGSPGGSTIERARYASQLYKQNLADIIIFSSGYTYKYNDAENMKLFAMSMSVPEKNIILEEKANSTYENVIYCLEIIKKRGIKSILVVSSPYNMWRAALVFKKQKSNIRILYTPVEDCQFFDRSGSVNLRQIRAILHEYLGVIYYFFKGYV